MIARYDSKTDTLTVILREGTPVVESDEDKRVAAISPQNMEKTGNEQVRSER